MARNTEIKSRLHSLEAVIKQISRMESSEPAVLNQEDTFFNIPDGRLKWRSMDQHSELIFYKRPDTSGPSISQYKRVETTGQPELKQMLQESLGVKGIVKKKRRLFIVGQTRIHLDEVEGLGNFLELEVVLQEHQNNAEGEAIIKDLMMQLKIDHKDLIKSAYIDLLLLR